MNYFIWKLSKYWNRIAYFIIDIGKAMIWDQTKANKDILKND